MPTNTNLTPGFISVEDAIKLIQSDTRQNPVVDMDWLVAHVVWLDKNGPAHNFRIPKIRRLAADEIRTNAYGKTIEYEQTGSVYVAINKPLENELLKDAILSKYRELVGHEYKTRTVKAVTTVADDAQGRAAVQPRTNTKPIAKEGASIAEGVLQDTNGEGIL